VKLTVILHRQLLFMFIAILFAAEILADPKINLAEKTS